MEILTLALIQIVRQTDLGELGRFIGSTSKLLNGLHLEGLGLDSDDLAGVEGLGVQLLEVGSFKDDSDGLVEIFLLLDAVAKGIGYTA